MKSVFNCRCWGTTGRKLGFGAVLVAVTLLLPGCGKASGSSAKSKGGAPAAQRKVTTVRVTERAIERSIIALGSLRAHEHAVLSAKVAGRLQAVQVDLGSRIKQGDVLAKIESRDYELQVKKAEATLTQARAALGLPLDGTEDKIELEEMSAVKEGAAVLAEAKANLDRMTRLQDAKIAPVSEVDTARAAYLVALNRYEDAKQKTRQQQALVVQRRAEYEIAQQELTDTKILAPFDGMVQERQADQGEYMNVASPILTVVRLDPLRLRVEVSERDAPKVALGQTIRFYLEGQTNVFTGTVQRLSPALDENTRMLIVEADIRNDGQLRSGYFVRAGIVTTPDAKALTIPTNALSSFAGLEKAYSIQKSAAVEKRVTTGQRGGDWVEVLSGLKRDDEVILHPGNLQTGNPVIVEGSAGAL